MRVRTAKFKNLLRNGFFWCVFLSLISTSGISQSKKCFLSLLDTTTSAPNSIAKISAIAKINGIEIAASKHLWRKDFTKSNPVIVFSNAFLRKSSESKIPEIKRVLKFLKDSFSTTIDVVFTGHLYRHNKHFSETATKGMRHQEDLKNQYLEAVRQLGIDPQFFRIRLWQEDVLISEYLKKIEGLEKIYEAHNGFKVRIDKMVEKIITLKGRNPSKAKYQLAAKGFLMEELVSLLNGFPFPDNSAHGLIFHPVAKDRASNELHDLVDWIMGSDSEAIDLRKVFDAENMQLRPSFLDLLL